VFCLKQSSSRIRAQLYPHATVGGKNYYLTRTKHNCTSARFIVWDKREVKSMHKSNRVEH